MKKLTFSIFLMLMPLMASAETVEIDGINYNLTAKDKTAVVKSKSSGKYTGDVIIPPKITYNDVDYDVTSIGTSAFSYCYGLTSIIIPNSVFSIGGSAFVDCTGIQSVIIPNSVKDIGNNAFSGCKGLTTVELGSGLTSIGNNAFHSCSSLTSITIPNSVTDIGSSAFYGCSKLTSITIPSSVTNLGNSAFALCKTLTSVELGNGLTSISDRTFYDCYGLISIAIPNSVTSIGQSAFNDCKSLQSVIIPNSVTNIGSLAFSGCANLEEVYCLAEKLSVESSNGEGLYTNPKAFSSSHPENILLHVLEPNIEVYRSVEPWKNFKNIIGHMLGDANGDKNVDVADIVEIVNYIMNTPSEKFDKFSADVNHDYQVNEDDIKLIVDMILTEEQK